MWCRERSCDLKDAHPASSMVCPLAIWTQLKMQSLGLCAVAFQEPLRKMHAALCRLQGHWPGPACRAAECGRRGRGRQEAVREGAPHEEAAAGLNEGRCLQFNHYRKQKHLDVGFYDVCWVCCDVMSGSERVQLYWYQRCWRLCVSVLCALLLVSQGPVAQACHPKKVCSMAFQRPQRKVPDSGLTEMFGCKHR